MNGTFSTDYNEGVPGIKYMTLAIGYKHRNPATMFAPTASCDRTEMQIFLDNAMDPSLREPLPQSSTDCRTGLNKEEQRSMETGS